MRLKCILLSILLGIMLVISSCDKFDCNDGLDGQWQMYEWQSSDGKHIGGKELKIYYSFQLQMMMFQKLSVSSGYLLSSFERNSESIRVFAPIKYKGGGHDEILDMDTLMQYGVPLDGVMMIERLSADTLILQNKETGKLCFRKY